MRAFLMFVLTVVLSACGSDSNSKAPPLEIVATTQEAIGAPGALLFRIESRIPPQTGETVITVYGYQTSLSFDEFLPSAIDVASGDTNGDKLDEIAIAPAIGSVHVFAGTEEFEPYGPTIAMLPTGLIAMGDLDHDGSDDLVQANPTDDGGSGIVAYNLNGQMFGYFNPEPPEFRTNGDLVACDLNADGFDEVVVADPGWRIFTHPTVNDPQLNPTAYFGGSQPLFGLGRSKLACADLNADGFDDLILGNRNDSCITVFTHPSKAPFDFNPAEQGTCVLSEENDEMVAGDLNGDGFAEIVIGRFVTNGTTGPGIGGIHLYSAEGHPLGQFFNGPPTFASNMHLAVGRNITNPLLDSDDDGLADAWEINGIDYDGDGCIDFDLRSRGADPFRKDLFVEIDAMDCTVAGSDCASDLIDPMHNHLPMAADLAPIVQAFANAPIPPPPGAPPGTLSGINLHIDLADADMVRHVNVCEFEKSHCHPEDFCEFIDPFIPCNSDVSCFDQIKPAFFGNSAERAGVGAECAANPARARTILAAKATVYRYNLWGHHHADVGSSGRAEGAADIDCGPFAHPVQEKSGNDFIVTLYGFSGVNGSPSERAGTFMHEFGHTLGLFHGGADKMNNKPNYVSVMNYTLQMGIPQFTGIPTTPVPTPPPLIFDYSRERLPDLVETDLDETLGIQGPPGLLTQFACPGGYLQSALTRGPVDWNCNQPLANPTDTHVSSDLNGDRMCILQSGTALQSDRHGDDGIVAGRSGRIDPGPDGKSYSATKHVVGPDDLVTVAAVFNGTNGVLDTAPIFDDVLVDKIVPKSAPVVLATAAPTDDIFGQIERGMNGVFETIRDPRDSQSACCILPGLDDVLQSRPPMGSDDDFRVFAILPGDDLTLETIPSPSDGTTGHLVTPGPDGVLDSGFDLPGLQNDDSLDVDGVFAGLDGVFQTPVKGDDVLLRQEIVDGSNDYCESDRIDDSPNDSRWDGSNRATSESNDGEDTQNRRLRGHDDWNNIVYDFRTATNFAAGLHYSAHDRAEMTSDEAEKIRTSRTVAEVRVLASVTPSVVVPGAPFTYRITVVNNGPETALSPVVAVTLPVAAKFDTCIPPSGARCSGGDQISYIFLSSLASGQSVTTELIGHVECSFTLGTNLVLAASLTTASFDPNPANNEVTVMTPTARPVPVFTMVDPTVTISKCTNVTLTPPLVTSACGGTVVVTNNRPSKFPLGRTVVTWTATTGSGTSATATQEVIAVLRDDTSCCPTGSTIRLGTPNNDNLTGTSGSDCILGLGSQDQINGAGGDDAISGGEGNDVVNGGTGNDRLYGGTGQDQLSGQDGNDILDGGDGDDICRGGLQNDTLFGGQGQDQLFGDDGTDSLFGQPGSDVLDGGAGNDYLEGGLATNDQCNGGAGTNLFAMCESPTVPSACTDSFRNGGETDLNCGGSGCPGCAQGLICTVGADCLGGVCSLGRCLVPLGPAQARLTTTADWGTGYCMSIDVTNVGTEPITNWNAAIQTNQSVIFEVSNGSFDAASGIVRVTPNAGHTAIAPGATRTSVGFCANRIGSNGSPNLLSASGVAG